MTTTQVTEAAKPLIMSPLKLDPPEVVVPALPEQTKGVVELPAERKAAVDAQLASYVQALLTANVTSDDFREKLDQAFAIGRQEIASATTLTNSFTEKDFAKDSDSPAYKAIADMRATFDELNPANQGDLFTPTKFLGIPIPFADKMQRYLRRYESATKQIGKLYENIIGAKDEVQRGVTELGIVRQRLWDSLTNLEAVEYFITELDSRLEGQIATLKMTDPHRAKALETEVLYYVRQNVGDVLTTKAVVVNAYNVAGELRKSGREVMNGCDRMATVGMASLSVAVTLAKAMGVQMKTMEMLVSSKKSIEDLIVWTGKALNQHVQMTTEFASNPVVGVQTLQTMFDQTFQAMDTMDTFREKALESMKTNNTMLRGQLTEQMKRITNERQVATVADGISL